MSDDASAGAVDGTGRRRWILLAGAIIATAVGIAVWQLGDREPTLVDRIELESGALSGWNVLLVSMDTVRHDRLHCYGRRQIHTPVIDELARNGVRFEQAVTSMPMTLPSHATMLTGLTPPNHGVRVNGMFRLDEKVPTLAGILKKRGYRTGAAIGAFVLDRRFGLHHGFDHYDDDLSTGDSSFSFAYRERPADHVNKAAEAWLRKNTDEPFFMFVHYFDPHWPFKAPEPFVSRYKDNDYGGYDAEIAFTDHQIGKLLDVLDDMGVRDRTLVIVTSDHGEGLGEHNEKTHSLLLYDATLRVPLIISATSAFPHNRLVSRQVGLIDLMPTILDLLGVEVPAGLDGVSLLRPGEPGPRALYIETLAPKFMHEWAPMVGVRQDNYKFVFAPQCELYDLRGDPKEVRNLFESDRKRASTMYDTLKTMVGGDPRFAGQVAGNLPVDEETRKKLGDLGYVVTASPTTTAASSQPKALPDPKEMMIAQRWILQAQTLMQSGQNAEALLLIERFLADHPDDVMALHVAGECYRSVGRIDESLAAFERATKHQYERAAAFAGIATGLLLKRKLVEADVAARRALECDATCANALLTLGLIRTDQERYEEALELFHQVIKEGRGTHDADAHSALGRLHFKQGNRELARQELNKALSLESTHRGALSMLSKLSDSDESRETVMAKLRETVKTQPNPRLLLQLGTFENEKGQYAEAAKYLRQGLVLESNNADILYQLAIALRKLGREDKALEYLRQAVGLGPTKPEPFSELGMILAGRKRLQEARSALERAAALAPRSPAYRYNLGIILIRVGDMQAAERAFRLVIKLQPDHAHAHHNLGIVLGSQGKAAEGQKHLRRAAELDPKLGQGGGGASKK